MIAKITGGGNFGGVLAYADRGLRDKGLNGKLDVSPSPRQWEHDDMHPSFPHEHLGGDDIGGAVGYASTNPSSPTHDSILLDHNLAGGRRKGETPQYIAAEMDKVRRTRKDIKEPVMHISIRWEEQDSKRMTTPDLRRYGREFLTRFGVDTSRHQYAMYTHNSAAGDPHLHIIVNRIPIVARERDAIGRYKRTPTIPTWQSKRRAQSVCRSMERAHRHAMTPVVEDKGWPKYFRALTSERTGLPCRRREVFVAITRAAKDPRSVDLNSFAGVLKSIDSELSVKEWRDTATGTTRGIKIIDAATMVMPKKIEKKGKVVEKDEQKDEQDTPQPKGWHPRGVHKQLTFGRISEQLVINKAKRQRVAGASRAMRELGEYYDRARADGRAAVAQERGAGRGTAEHFSPEGGAQQPPQPDGRLKDARAAGARTDQRLDKMKEREQKEKEKEEREAPAPSPGLDR